MEYRSGRITQEYRRWDRPARLAASRRQPKVDVPGATWLYHAPSAERARLARIRTDKRVRVWGSLRALFTAFPLAHQSRCHVQNIGGHPHILASMSALATELFPEIFV